MKEETNKQITRWYDNDPVLSKSMDILKQSDDETQIKIALNLIKVIIEHHITDSNFIGVADILIAADDEKTNENNELWININEALKTALDMLSSSPKQIQKHIAKEMANIIIRKFNDNYLNEEELTQ